MSDFDEARSRAIEDTVDDAMEEARRQREDFDYDEEDDDYDE